MLHHVTLKVSDLKASLAFYKATFTPLGIIHLYNEGKDFAGFGIEENAFFWIARSPLPISGMHIALIAPSRGAVDAFHATALKAGAHNNGKPGLRPHYQANYYAAFALDPDGHNIEAICFLPEM